MYLFIWLINIHSRTFKPSKYPVEVCQEGARNIHFTDFGFDALPWRKVAWAIEKAYERWDVFHTKGWKCQCSTVQQKFPRAAPQKLADFLTFLLQADKRWTALQQELCRRKTAKPLYCSERLREVLSECGSSGTRDGADWPILQVQWQKDPIEAKLRNASAISRPTFSGLGRGQTTLPMRHLHSQNGNTLEMRFPTCLAGDHLKNWWVHVSHVCMPESGDVLWIVRTHIAFQAACVCCMALLSP